MRTDNEHGRRLSRTEEENKNTVEHPPFQRAAGRCRTLPSSTGAPSTKRRFRYQGAWLPDGRGRRRRSLAPVRPRPACAVGVSRIRHDCQGEKEKKSLETTGQWRMALATAAGGGSPALGVATPSAGVVGLSTAKSRLDLLIRFFFQNGQNGKKKPQRWVIEWGRRVGGVGSRPSEPNTKGDQHGDRRKQKTNAE